MFARGAALRRPGTLLASLVLLATTLSAVHAEEVCFKPKDDENLPFAVIQQAPPPMDDDEPNYRYRPLTDTASMQLGRLNESRAKRIGLYYFQWGNRSNQRLFNRNGRLLERKANIQPGVGGPQRARTQFSSIERANACTLAQTAFLLGMPDVATSHLSGVGIESRRESDISADETQDSHDLCVLPAMPLTPRVKGVALDYEVADGRTPEQTLEFLKRYAALVHGAGKKAILLTDPLDAPTQIYTGMAESNAGELARSYDYLSLWLWSGNRQRDIRGSFNAQLAMVRAHGPVDPSRLLAVFELAKTSLDDAQVVRELVLSNHLGGVMLWRNLAQQGGSCDTDTNRKIACLVLGRCSR